MNDKIADYGAWLVKGGDGLLAMIERLTAERHALTAISIGQLKTLHARLGAVIREQEAMSEDGH